MGEPNDILVENHAETWKRHIRWLFIETIDDIRARSTFDQTDPYTSLGIAPLLRKLYIDGGSLLGEVNRQLRCKVEFSLRPWDPNAEASRLPFSAMPPERLKHIFFSQGEHIDPGLSLTWPPPRRVSLDSWLRQVVAAQGQETITIKDYIKQVANQEGGVHFGPLETRKQKVLFTLANIQHGPAFVPNMQYNLLRAIGRISVAAMDPLVEALRTP